MKLPTPPKEKTPSVTSGVTKIKSASEPDVAGYPQKDIKTSGIKMRGTNAQTKGKMCRGPMA